MDNLGSPAQRMTAVVPSDTVDLNPIPRFLYVTVAGNVKCRFNGDAATDIVLALTIGYHWIMPTRIFNTGTTATGIVAAA